MSRIKGLSDFTVKLRSLPRAIETSIAPPAMAKAMEPIRDTARSLAPSVTGATRAGIRLKRGRARRGKITVRVVINRTTADFHAAFVDLGTSEIHAEHFMRRAANGLPQAGADATDSIRRGIVRHLGH